MNQVMTNSNVHGMFGQVSAAPVAIKPTAAWICLDIETGDAPDHVVEAKLAEWTPPANIKDPYKIEDRRQEAMAKIRERAALLDASPVLCIAVVTDQEKVIFNGMGDSRPVIEGWAVIPCGDEADMLKAFRAWLDANTDPATTLISGHNARGFDLPKLRQAYLRYRLRLPDLFRPAMRGEDKAELVDTMALFKAYSMEHRDAFAVSLDAVAATLGIERPKQVISGDEVPRLHREGQYDAILIYCVIDTATTARAFQLMTGIAGDLA